MPRKMLSSLRNRLTVIVHDLFMIPLAWLGAYWLRFNLGEIPEQMFQRAIYLLPVVIVIQGALFHYFGLYRGVWRFASIPDLARIFKAVLMGILLSAIIIFFFTRLQMVPRSVFVLDGVLLVLLLGGPRFIYRWFTDRRFYNQEATNVLIIGAGKAGEMLVRDLLRDPANVYRPIGFVDDDTTKKGKEIHGVRVFYGLEAIPDLCAEYDVSLIVIALPSANAKQMQRVVDHCESSGVTFRSLPKMQDLVSGQISINDLREVRIEDLLGREPVSIDWTTIQKENRGKTVMVTGGGGSIGSELCRQLANLEVRKLIVVDQSEYNLFTVDCELRETHPDLRLSSILADVTDKKYLSNIFERERPDIVFHAAAYKHVPLLEDQTRTATLNNIIGTKNVAELADSNGCESFVMISTDKAVNPGNLMGTTKRVAEIFCQSINAISSTKFVTVRFGNVLGSAGSVIPIFRKQIENGGPVTVTHPDITRYFMTIPEASQLILEAATMGNGGEIYVLDMGDPVKISYLAEQMIRLSGKKPGEDIEITYTGLRRGEKLYEELFHDKENMSATRHQKIMKSNSRIVSRDDVIEAFSVLEKACKQNDQKAILAELDRLVPERSQNRDKESLSATHRNNVIPLKSR